MENKLKMMKQIGFISICITAVAMLISLVFKDKAITIGLALGCLIGLIGFNMILQWGLRVQQKNSSRSAFFNYMLRYIFYGCMIALSYFMGANLIGVLLGFVCHKVAIYVYSLRQELR